MEDEMATTFGSDWFIDDESFDNKAICKELSAKQASKLIARLNLECLNGAGNEAVIFGNENIEVFWSGASWAVAVFAQGYFYQEQVDKVTQG